MLQNYRIQIRAFDNLRFITDAAGKLDPQVDLVVPVRAKTLPLARVKAVKAVRTILRKHWSKDDFATLGPFESRKAIG